MHSDDFIRGLRYRLRGCVLMPCRALDAFGLDIDRATSLHRANRLNALSGIGCIRT